jgi:gas vesicle protein
MNKEYLAGMLVGGAIGAALGLLLAPDSGAKTCGEIAEAVKPVSKGVTVTASRFKIKHEPDARSIKQAI